METKKRQSYLAPCVPLKQAAQGATLVFTLYEKAASDRLALDSDSMALCRWTHIIMRTIINWRSVILTDL